MSSNNESQWGNDREAAQRGPAFEDPSNPSSPMPHAPAPGQALDGPGDWQMAAEGYGSAPQASPYGGGAPGPQGAPHGGQQYSGQNLYGQQYPAQSPYSAPATGYEPYGVHGGYGAYGYGQPLKSKTAAALLAFFLGGLGVHNFYLGKTTLGLIHVGLAVGSMLAMVGGAVAATSSSNPDSPLIGLVIVGYLAAMGNSIWAFVEFVMILVKPEHELGR